MDFLYQLVQIVQSAAGYLIDQWPNITRAVANLVAALFVLKSIGEGLLPYLQDAWELLKKYFGFGAVIVRDTIASVKPK